MDGQRRLSTALAGGPTTVMVIPKAVLLQRLGAKEKMDLEDTMTKDLQMDDRRLVEQHRAGTAWRDFRREVLHHALHQRDWKRSMRRNRGHVFVDR